MQRWKWPLIMAALVAIGCTCLAGLLLLTPLGFVLIPFQQAWNSSRTLGEYDRRKDYYDGVIRTIERELKVPGQSASYEFPVDPARLIRRPATDPEIWPSRERSIHARRSSDGSLRVSFSMFDMGHAGVWFLLYFSGDESHDTIKGLYPAEPTRVAPHWWAVEDRSG